MGPSKYTMTINADLQFGSATADGVQLEVQGGYITDIQGLADRYSVVKQCLPRTLLCCMDVACTLSYMFLCVEII